VVAQAGSIEELASTIGVDAAGLRATTDRFNTFVRAGTDEDFGRGTNAVSRRYGDRDAPHPNLGTVEEPPFYAVRLYTLSAATGAAGISTGLSGRVLRVDGSAIEGLYAVGSCTSYTPSCGVGYNSGYSLSRALTFGALAAEHIAAS
jgi:3-oxosteroid 1-dehydrogenase